MFVFFPKSLGVWNFNKSQVLSSEMLCRHFSFFSPGCRPCWLDTSSMASCQQHCHFRAENSAKLDLKSNVYLNVCLWLINAFSCLQMSQMPALQLKYVSILSEWLLTALCRLPMSQMSPKKHVWTHQCIQMLNIVIVLSAPFKKVSMLLGKCLLV